MLGETACSELGRDSTKSRHEVVTNANLKRRGTKDYAIEISADPAQLC